jgi:hypothetical protein
MSFHNKISKMWTWRSFRNFEKGHKSFGSIHEWASSVSLWSFHCSWYTPVQCADLSRFKLLECYPFATNFWSHHHAHCCCTLLCK